MSDKISGEPQVGSPLDGSVTRVKKILDSDQPDRDKLEMLFSNRMDVWFQDRGAISAKVWDQLFDDLIHWKQNAKNEGLDAPKGEL